MSRIGVYSTDTGDIPAIINQLEAGKYNILALGNANAKRWVDQSDVSFVSGADSKEVYVDSLDDFSGSVASDLGITVVGDEITIPSNVVVKPVGLIDLGSAHILLDGGTIMGRDAVVDGFLSTTTGGVIRHNGGTLSSKDYFIVAPNGPGFVGVGSKANNDILKLNMIGVFSSPLGFDLTGYEVPSLDNCFIGQLQGFPQPAVGVKFEGTVGKVHVQNTPFFDFTDAAIVLGATMDAGEMDIAGNYYESVAGVKFLKAITGWNLQNVAEIVRNVPRGEIAEPEDRLENIPLFDVGFDFVSNPGIPDSKAIGVSHQGSTFETTTVTVQGDPYKANITATASPLNQRYSVDPDGTLHYQGLRPWTVLVTVDGRVSTASNNTQVEFSIYKDGVEIPESVSVARIATGGDQRNFNCTSIVYIEPPSWHDPVVGNCTIELYVKNLSGTADIDLADVTIRATS